MSEKETDILARTIYGEARGESISGMEAVASVVLNRVAFANRRGRFWWGNSIAEVCRAPKQFSCWNRNDPNYRLICRVADTDIVFCICKRIAGRAVAGLLEDKTNGATHYHTRHVWPAWAKGKIPCAEIGRHFFYNDIEK
nr:MAG TPA: Cell Wall Hydrolase [Caudoviricetes sp.]